jgi:hypothetical protein
MRNSSGYSLYHDAEEENFVYGWYNGPVKGGPQIRDDGPEGELVLKPRMVPERKNVQQLCAKIEELMWNGDWLFIDNGQSTVRKTFERHGIDGMLPRHKAPLECGKEVDKLVAKLRTLLKPSECVYLQKGFAASYYDQKNWEGKALSDPDYGKARPVYKRATDKSSPEASMPGRKGK